MRTSFTAARIAAALALGAAGAAVTLAGCGDSSSVTGVTTSTATAVTASSGSNQQTAVGTAAASPLVVTVTNESGNAVAGVTVAFAITSGGGSLSATSATTDANGQASTSYAGGATAGTATVSASVAGLASATFSIVVGATTTTTDCSSATASTTVKVVCLANAFKATLSTAQQTGVQYTLSSANWVKWSNLPTTFTARNGLALGSLSSTQLAAALALAQAALSAQGYQTFDQLRLADSYLNANGGGGSYGAGLYYVAFLGTPSATSRWMLQIGGHHWAYNLDVNGAVPSTPVTPTPMFVGLEPQTFTSGGTTYAPLAGRRDAMYAVLASLSASQLASAKLTSSFSDVLLGPGQDGNFPAHQGLQGSSLTSAQLALVKPAIEPWVNALPPAEAAQLLSLYESDAALASTYVAWSGASTPTVQGSYVRIDGPRVWIEFVCQNGIVFQNQIHYHTIWRDRASDYGGTLSASSTAAAATTLERWLASPHYATPSGPLTVYGS
ncbi:hypothetical protein tb265_41270 [Gemmatimonadetes bacterium T265]|nr:hypothetical protein tb265_41270 [Gemmatimonadetes bacterium T265]